MSARRYSEVPDPQQSRISRPRFVEGPRGPTGERESGGNRRPYDHEEHRATNYAVLGSVPAKSSARELRMRSAYTCSQEDAFLPTRNPFRKRLRKAVGESPMVVPLCKVRPTGFGANASSRAVAQVFAMPPEGQYHLFGIIIAGETGDI